MPTRLINCLLIVVVAFLLINCNANKQPSEPTPTSVQAAADKITPHEAASPLSVEKRAEQASPAGKLSTYRGETGYTGVRQYEVDYEPSQWRLIEDFDANPLTPHDERLQNIQDSTCFIGLFNGPMQRIHIESIELAGRKWELAPRSFTVEKPTQTTVSIIVYATNAIDPVAGNIQYYLTVYVPAPYEPPNKSECQQQAEQVIATFRIVDSIRQP